MIQYWKYTKYLVRHIWYVRKACWHNGLYWQGLIHDLSKWLPSEFIPYANFFYGKDAKPRRDKTGYYKPTSTGDDAFDFAWLLHQKRNKHHWQFWVLPEDDGGVKVLLMPIKYAKEMMCDWWGASMSTGHEGKNADWYAVNKDKMQLHPETRKFIENNIQNSSKPYRLFYDIHERTYG